MQGPFSTRRGAVLYLLVWLMLGAVFSALIVGSGAAAWVNALLFALPLTLVYGCAVGFSAYYLCRAYPLSDKSVASIVLVFGVSAVICGVAWTAATLAWNKLGGSIGVDWIGIQIGAPMKSMIFGLGVLMYCVSAVAHYLAIEFQRARSAERRELESQLMAQEAELRMLRTQIDPHFLFNSLNSISALTSINPVGARDMTLRLADFFRHSLGLEAHSKVTLDAELTLIMHFLAIEQVRFGARLRVQQDIDDAAKLCLLPPMILQPLVENAVKHGIGNLTGGGVVHIAAQRVGSILRLSVTNDIDQDMPAAVGNGIGLVNVRQRLAAAYGHQAGATWSRTDNQFRVELALPAETKEPLASCA